MVVERFLFQVSGHTDSLTALGYLPGIIPSLVCICRACDRMWQQVARGEAVIQSAQRPRSSRIAAKTEILRPVDRLLVGYAVHLKL